MNFALLFMALVAGCNGMDFTLDYTFSDGPARVHSAMTIRGERGVAIRQVASGAEKPIGLWQGTVSAATVEALWAQMPASAPPGAVLRPGMPNHWIRMKREGVEKSIRLAHDPAVLEKVRPFLDVLRTVQQEASVSMLRTLAIRFSGWNDQGAIVELTAGGIQDVTIPNGEEAIVVQSAPETSKYPLTAVGKGPASEILIPAGRTVSITIPMARAEGRHYQTSYRRRGVTKEAGGEIFGDAGSALAPR